MQKLLCWVIAYTKLAHTHNHVALYAATRIYNYVAIASIYLRCGFVCAAIEENIINT